MTSSNYLKSGLRFGLAFPITLAAVGLLLASLVLGFGSNSAQALGDKNAGICAYSDVMRQAILDNAGLESYQCDDDAFTNVAAAPTSDAWGGPATDNNGAKELDLSSKGLTTFAPGKGELDAFRPGSRVDLRGNGLSVADIDLSAATGSYITAAADATADDPATEYRQFGESIKGLSTAAVADRVGTNAGVTFLLDGGSTTSNGFATAEFEATENGIGWILFELGNKGKWLVDWGRDTDPSDGITHASNPVVAVLRFDISAQTHDFAGVSTARTDSVYAVIESTDSAGTLYAIPYRIANDDEIEDRRAEKNEIVVTLVGIGTHANALAGSDTTDPAGLPTVAASNTSFQNSLEIDGADFIITDDDSPAVSVCDRSKAAESAIRDALADKNCRAISKGHLAKSIDTSGSDNNVVGGGTDPNQILAIGHPFEDNPVGSADDRDKITAITPDDLSGLTGLVRLNLAGNALTELPSGLFADVGTDTTGDLSTRIDVRNNEGPTGSGFTLENIGPAGDELSAGQHLIVDVDGEEDKRVGFLQDGYEAVEGGVLVMDINVRPADSTETALLIQFHSYARNSGTTADDVKEAIVNLTPLDVGNHRIAIGLPTNGDEDTDNTLTAIFGYGTDATAVTNALDFVQVTIRDMSYEAPVMAPDVPESSFDSVVVTQNEYVEAPGNEDLKHNISNFTVTVGGNAVSANFLDVYNATGGLERWGYPTSEVVEIPGIGLTQFFQRGALHLESNAEVKRLLAWDFVGGGEGGSTDQGVEPAPETAPEGGEQVGAFGHFVANVDADGNATGFLDFFTRLGGEAAFGFPKTEARADTGADGTLMEPGTTPGFTRQYFQAAVFQLAEDGSVQLTLLGDTLRGILVPGYADIDAFGAADALSVGDEVSPPVIDS